MRLSLEYFFLCGMLKYTTRISTKLILLYRLTAGVLAFQIPVHRLELEGQTGSLAGIRLFEVPMVSWEVGNQWRTRSCIPIVYVYALKNFYVVGPDSGVVGRRNPVLGRYMRISLIIVSLSVSA